MNIYKVKRTTHADSEDVISMVVSAPNEETARRINPFGQGERMRPQDWNESWWVNSPDETEVVLLGHCVKGLGQTVIAVVHCAP
jgi:hypothetical protein